MAIFSQKEILRRGGVFLFAFDRESNPRALGKVPGAPCNPRRPAPQRRSIPPISTTSSRTACRSRRLFCFAAKVISHLFRRSSFQKQSLPGRSTPCRQLLRFAVPGFVFVFPSEPPSRAASAKNEECSMHLSQIRSVQTLKKPSDSQTSDN